MLPVAVVRRLLLVLPPLALACGGSDLVLPGNGGPAAITVARGNGQSAAPGAVLPDSIVVKVVDPDGVPLSGQKVAFAPGENAEGAIVTPDTAITGADGMAGARWVLGDAEGDQHLVASVVEAAALEVEFTAAAARGGSESRPPTAMSDRYETIEGFNHTLTVGASGGVLQNDLDPDGDQLTAAMTSQPANGSAALESDGSFSYTPEASFFGEDQFTYRASDGSGNSSTATVTIAVAPVNDPPRFRDGGDESVKQNGGRRQVKRWATGISPGADNEADQVLTFEVSNDNPQLFTPDGQPTVTQEEATRGTLTFKPAGQAGSAIVTVVLRDNGGTANGGSDTSVPHRFTITVRQ